MAAAAASETGRRVQFAPVPTQSGQPAAHDEVPPLSDDGRTPTSGSHAASDYDGDDGGDDRSPPLLQAETTTTTATTTTAMSASGSDDDAESGGEHRARSLGGRISEVMYLPRFHLLWLWVYLLLLGGGIGAVATVIMLALDMLAHLQLELLYEWCGENHVYYFFLYGAHGMLWIFVSLTLVAQLAPSAAGSGIPEVKCILSGVADLMREMLSFPALCTKVMSLICSVGSGLFIGAEGPFVMIGAQVANNLARIPPFGFIHKNGAMLQQMLAAGAAAGIAGNFGSPVGGVLLSIEVTSTYYPLRNYWYAFVTSVSAGALIRLTWNVVHHGVLSLAPLSPSDFSGSLFDSMDLGETVLFVLLGVVGGIGGAVWVKVNEVAVTAYKRFTPMLPVPRPWMAPYAAAVLIVGAWWLLTYPFFIGKFMAMRSFNVLSALTSEKNLNDVAEGVVWDRPSLFLNLVLLLLVRYVHTAVGVTLPLASGLFIPVLTLGAITGRLYGETLHEIAVYLLGHPISHINPGGYALVGASAMAAGVTGKLSCAVIVLELTGGLDHIIPILIATIVAVFVAERLNLNIYDRMVIDKGLPYLPELDEHVPETPARDIMMPHGFPYIVKGEYDAAALERALQALPQYCNTLAVVLSHANKELVGQVSRLDVEQALRSPDDNWIDRLCEPIPLPLSENTPLSSIHILFITARLMNAYVVSRYGEVVGMLTRKELKQAINAHSSPKYLRKLKIL